MHSYYLHLHKQNYSTVLKRCFVGGYQFCLEILIWLQPGKIKIEQKIITTSQISLQSDLSAKAFPTMAEFDHLNDLNLAIIISTMRIQICSIFVDSTVKHGVKYPVVFCMFSLKHNGGGSHC